MRLPRSWLLVPGDDERAVTGAFGHAADIVVFDLAPVATERRELAVALVTDALCAAPGPAAVRIGSLSSAADLATLRGAPAFVVLPRAEGGADVEHLAALLAVAEAESGIADGATRIIASAADTARAVFSLGTYAGTAPRLAALLWDPHALAASHAAARVHAPTASLARTLLLMGAAAAGVPAIDSAFADLVDGPGLAAEAAAAAADGFAGKLAAHPSEVETINAAFAHLTAGLTSAPTEP